MTAALLDLPLATSVIAERLSEDRNRVTVERELEAGRREVLELPLPCVLTVQTGINLPRYPSLTNKLRARKQQIEVLSLADFPTAPACQGPSRLLVPPTPAGGVVLEGPLADQAEALVRVFYEKSLLR
jgi:electron transfer flavoprotein beta subunit